MKIIYLINSMDLGGAERLLIDTVNHLLVMSLDVEVIVIKDGYLPYEKEMKDLLGTRCHFLHCTDYSILTMVKVIKKLYEVKSKNKGKTILHTHLFPSFFYGSVFKIIYPNIYLFFTEHDTKNNRRYGVKKYIDRLLYVPLHKVICISSGVKYELLTNYPGLVSKSKVIYNGIQMSEPKEVYSSFSKEDKIKCVTVGRLEHKKNHKKALDCLLQSSTIHLTIIGEGSLRFELERYAEYIGVRSRVVFTGALPSVKSELKKFDLYLHTAEVEGFGLVIAEAMSAGLPVFCVKAPGLDEVGGDFAYYFESPDGFWEELQKYMSFSQDFRIAMIKRSRAYVLKEFSIAAHVEKLLMEYDG